MAKATCAAMEWNGHKYASLTLQLHVWALEVPSAIRSVFELGKFKSALFLDQSRQTWGTRAWLASISRKSHQDASKHALPGAVGPSVAYASRSLIEAIDASAIWLGLFGWAKISLGAASGHPTSLPELVRQRMSGRNMPALGRLQVVGCRAILCRLEDPHDRKDQVWSQLKRVSVARL